MNKNKICFIYCVNDEFLYKESVRYINSLHVPEGISVECIAVTDAASMTSGYNRAMNQSDAKYKVYLHQDVFIINKNFIVDVISLFNDNLQLGLLGVVGAKKLPASGRLWEARDKFGKVYDSHTGQMKEYTFMDIDSAEYNSVQGISGFMMITQYDLPWREDIFTGWQFYDLSQSAEFINMGYEVGVPRQVQPWVIHDCGMTKKDTKYERYQQLFLEEYKEDKLPLVSVLIPTYNRPHYCELALRSVIDQTYRNIEVVICDDSTNDDTKYMIEKYLVKYPFIRYYKNETNLGQFDNDIKCIDLAKGQYINFLMDDDLFHIEKIEKMMEYFLGEQGEEIKIVTSRRQLIDEHGHFLKEKKFNLSTEETTIFDGLVIGNIFLRHNHNFFGEPTTVLFRKCDLTVPFGTLNGRRYGCNVDSSTWLNLMSTGKVVFIAEVLSYFRIHGEQQSQMIEKIVEGLIDYGHQIVHAPQLGFLEKQDDRLRAIETFYETLTYLQNHYGIKCLEALPVYEEVQQYTSKFNKDFEKLQRKKIEEQPLVSVLIPAYNRPGYLEEALLSVLNQTYKNIEVVICDDSTNNEVQEMMQPYLQQYKNIRYYKNEKNLFIYNSHKCFELSQGKYINYLMDDDLFHPTKIEKMVAVLEEKQDVTLVTSYRHFIDDNGDTIQDPANKPLFEEDKKISGIKFVDWMLSDCCNRIGEPTTVMFRKTDLVEPFGCYKGREFTVINDMASWIGLLSKGSIMYLTEGLSSFRLHQGQNQKNLLYYRNNISEWIDIILLSKEDRFLSEDSVYKKALHTALNLSIQVIDYYYSHNKTSMLKEVNFERLTNLLRELTD